MTTPTNNDDGGYAAGEYTKLQPRQYAPRALRETPEGKYWRRFKAPTVAPQFGPVTHLDYCRSSPHHLACTASTRVVLYAGQGSAGSRGATAAAGGGPAVLRTLSRFGDKAYGATWRSDGKLVVAGSEDGVVRVFDTSSRAVLRQLKGHAPRAARVARFAPDKAHVLTGGDDVTVRWWDVAAGKQLRRLDGHTDYVRAAACVGRSGGGGGGASSDLWATGGYDHAVRLWDVRDRSAKAARVFDHGAPVESLAPLPGGGALLASAGGPSVCVWDLTAAGGGAGSGGNAAPSSSSSSSAAGLLKRMANFQKTVTCLAVCPRAGPQRALAPRLLAGSLDGHVKVFELDAFGVTAASRYPAAVLSLAISPDAGAVAVGMADGSLCVRRRKKVAGEDAWRRVGRVARRGVGGGSEAAADGGAAAAAGPSSSSAAPADADATTATTTNRASEREAARLAARAARREQKQLQQQQLGGAGGGGGGKKKEARLTADNFRYFLRGRSAKAARQDHVVAARRRARLAAHDQALRRFRYAEALDAALASKRAAVVDALLEELAARGALGAALGGRDARSLEPLLRHLARHVPDPRRARLLAGVAHRVLDAYAGVVGADAAVDARLAQLRDAARDEVALGDALAGVQGCLEPLLAASLLAGMSLADEREEEEERAAGGGGGLDGGSSGEGEEDEGEKATMGRKEAALAGAAGAGGSGRRRPPALDFVDDEEDD
jgi:U3 small nucleolar RNA-associated protein 15